MILRLAAPRQIEAASDGLRITDYGLRITEPSTTTDVSPKRWISPQRKWTRSNAC